MTEPPPRRPQGPYPPPGGYGPPGSGGRGWPEHGGGPPPVPRHPGPPYGRPQGPLPGNPPGPRARQPQGAPQVPSQAPAAGGVRPPVAAGMPPAPSRRRSPGKIVAIVVVALVVLGVGGFAVWKGLGGQSSNGAVDAGSNDPAGSAGLGGSGAAAGSPLSCSLVAAGDVAAVLGGEGWTVIDAGATVTRAYDSRVLAGVATSCVATDAGNEKLARIARYQGGDAAARFAEEKQKASRGGRDGPYLGADVQAGDQAFCTTGSKTLTAGSSAGALVRRGDTLVYVSTTAAGEGASDKANCDLSLRLIDKVHPR
jgi:hypothetical protein